jgi:CRP-like cAMP-binding protein
VIEEKGEDSPMMYVVMIGTVGLFSSKNVCDQKITANQVFGMNFNRSQTLLNDNENNRVRRATAVTLTDTICLSLDFPSYYDQVYILEHNYKQQRFSLINQLKLFQEWDIDKKKLFNGMLGQRSYREGEVIYDIDEKPDRIFFLMRGQLVVETELEIDQKNQFPIVSEFKA